MTQILEYISQNYIWFLGMAILILLAIIGYYADKTNFGQGKSLNDMKSESYKQPIEENKKSLNDLNEINEETDEFDVQNYSLTQNNELTDVDEQSINNQIEKNEFGNSEQLENKILDEFDADSLVGVVEEEKNEHDVSNAETQETNIILSDEEINKFNNEFDLILPKKELMDTDLLDDIDDLNLDKTQKIDLSDLPNLEDIELPKIKPLSVEEKDIWKF